MSDIVDVWHCTNPTDPGGTVVDDKNKVNDDDGRLCDDYNGVTNGGPDNDGQTAQTASSPGRILLLSTLPSPGPASMPSPPLKCDKSSISRTYTGDGTFVGFSLVRHHAGQRLDNGLRPGRRERT